MKTDPLSEIRALLRDSLELAHIRYQLAAWSLGYAAGLVMCILPDIGIPKVNAMMALFVSLLFLPVLLGRLWRVGRIFRSVGEYVICPTELTQPRHAPLMPGMFTFCGVVQTEAQGRFLVETSAIFAGRGIIQPLMEDYLGRTVTVCWNRETNVVVVIG